MSNCVIIYGRDTAVECFKHDFLCHFEDHKIGTTKTRKEKENVLGDETSGK